jgi:uncharacterized protein with HEPN domain
MSSRSDRDWLLDIQEAGERIATYTASMDCATFLVDEKTQTEILDDLR